MRSCRPALVGPWAERRRAAARNEERPERQPRISSPSALLGLAPLRVCAETDAYLLPPPAQPAQPNRGQAVRGDVRWAGTKPSPMPPGVPDPSSPPRCPRLPHGSPLLQRGRTECAQWGIAFCRALHIARVLWLPVSRHWGGGTDCGKTTIEPTGSVLDRLCWEPNHRKSQPPLCLSRKQKTKNKK